MTEAKRKVNAVLRRLLNEIYRLALALLMALILRTNNHNLAVPLDYLALVAHRLN